MGADIITGAHVKDFRKVNGRVTAVLLEDGK